VHLIGKTSDLAVVYAFSGERVRKWMEEQGEL